VPVMPPSVGRPARTGPVPGAPAACGFRSALACTLHPTSAWPWCCLRRSHMLAAAGGGPSGCRRGTPAGRRLGCGPRRVHAAGRGCRCVMQPAGHDWGQDRHVRTGGRAGCPDSGSAGAGTGRYTWRDRHCTGDRKARERELHRGSHGPPLCSAPCRARRNGTGSRSLTAG
jgi:hypothetical protein